MSAARIWPGISAVLLTIMFIVFMTAYPQQTLQAALTGVSIWWDVLFPALFPFFIIAELLLSFGIVHFFGTLLDPLMRPLFRVPGIGGFVMAMGFASGYPVGARLTSQLWDQRLVNRVEGERLVAFTSTSDPIFLIGAVAVGFFYNPEIALILSVAHYGSSVIIGLLMRFYEKGTPLTPPTGMEDGNILLCALRNMHRARLAHMRPFGEMLRDAAVTALKLIFVIGGLVVFFAVLIEILKNTNVIQMMIEIISWLLSLAGIPSTLADAFINGLFEVTLGARSAGSASGISLVYQVATAAFILSWAGLSVHAQIISLMSHTGMRYGPFLIARFAHGLCAMVMVFTLWGVLRPDSTATLAQLSHLELGSSPPSLAAVYLQPHIIILFALFTLTVLVTLSLIIHIGRKLLSDNRPQ